jgi:hypothetical protein
MKAADHDPYRTESDDEVVPAFDGAPAPTNMLGGAPAPTNMLDGASAGPVAPAPTNMLDLSEYGVEKQVETHDGMVSVIGLVFAIINKDRNYAASLVRSMRDKLDFNAADYGMVQKRVRGISTPLIPLDRVSALMSYFKNNMPKSIGRHMVKRGSSVAVAVPMAVDAVTPPGTAVVKVVIAP